MPSAASAKLEKASSVPVAESPPSASVISAVNAATIAATAPTIAAVPGAGATASSSAATAVVSIDNASSISTPIKQTLVIIEHKIRNLEKRKTKLESYRAIQASGKELSADQKQAVAKYDEVAQCLDFARELTKQMIQLSNNAEKDQKKLARREAVLRAQAETLKIREVLTIQNILSSFEDANVREDFINGTNGAIKLEEKELNTLEKFYEDIFTKRAEKPGDSPYLVTAQKAAEFFSFTVDGRPKQYRDTTFENVRKIFQSIQECGYLDRAGKVEGTDEEIIDETETDQMQSQDDEKTDFNTGDSDQDNATSNEMLTDDIGQSQLIQPQQTLVSHVDVPKFEAPSAAAVPAPSFPQPAILQQPQAQPSNLISAQIPSQQSQLQRSVMVPPVVAAAGVIPQQQQVAQVQPVAVAPPAAGNQLHAGHFPPTTVRAVEQGYFKQHQYIQQMRPLAEVIGSTNFYFLQESELDSPDMIQSGFAPNDGQTVATAINPGLMPPQSPSTIPQQIIQQQQQQQSPQQQMVMPQPGTHQQSQPISAPTIPSQTFTNQSFPPIVPPPTAIYPQAAVQQNSEIPNTQQQPQQLSIVYPPQQQAPQQQPGSMQQIQSLVPPQQAIVSQQNQAQILSSLVDNQQPVVDVISQAANAVNLMTGPSGANVPLPGFPPQNKFQQPQNPAMIGVHPQSINQLPIKDSYDSMQQQSQQQSLNDKQHHPQQQLIDDIKDSRTNDNSNDWDAHEHHVPHNVSSSARNDDDSNQWNNDVTNSSSGKNDWSSNYDNQNDSNTWKNIPNDNYGGRNGGRNNFSGGNNRSSGGGRGGSGMRGSNAGGGPPSNGYRGRSNNSYQQQQNGGRNTGMYFRNNDNNSGYYQNGGGGGGGGNGGGGNGGYNNKDSTGNYVGNTNSNYRPRGGPVPQTNRQQSGGRVGGPSNNTGGPPQPPRNGGGPNQNRSNVGSGGMSANPNARPTRNNNANPGSAYGNSRPPPNNVRQQQDINA